MPSWPAELPQKQFLGTTEKDTDQVVRTSMDAGPPTRRRKYAARVAHVSVPMIMTGTQKDFFDTFFRDTLKGGSLSFDWDDPTRDEATTYAFRSPPSWTLTRGGSPSTRIWSTMLELEIQP